MGELDQQLRLIVECLDRHRVSYVVIGGVAAMLQDVPIPETLDVDVVPERKTKNLKSLANAQKEMEARLRVPGEADGIEIPLDERTFRGVATMTFITRFGPSISSSSPPALRAMPSSRVRPWCCGASIATSRSPASST